LYMQLSPNFRRLCEKFAFSDSIKSSKDIFQRIFKDEIDLIESKALAQDLVYESEANAVRLKQKKNRKRVKSA